MSRSATTRFCTSVESMSGRSTRTRSEPASHGTSEAWCRVLTPSQSSSAEQSFPYTASGSEVVGLVTATRARSCPITALNSDDLPDPVAPAKTTIVDSMSTPRRPAIFWLSARACSVTEAASLPWLRAVAFSSATPPSTRVTALTATSPSVRRRGPPRTKP